MNNKLWESMQMTHNKLVEMLDFEHFWFGHGQKP